MPARSAMGPGTFLVACFWQGRDDPSGHSRSRKKVGGPGASFISPVSPAEVARRAGPIYQLRAQYALAGDWQAWSQIRAQPASANCAQNAQLACQLCTPKTYKCMFPRDRDAGCALWRE